MSRKKVIYVTCDRCGKVFDDSNNPLNMWMNFQSFRGPEIFKNGERQYDLCEDCEYKFIKWFKGEKHEQL